MSAIAGALARRQPAHALPREFHLSSEIYAAELERIWRRSWLFAGLSVQAPSAGDYFSFELGDDSILIVRDEDGTLRALHNTCRHRGMRVCAATGGNTKRWVCPYHQWSYALDGGLLGAGGMERELDLSDHGLFAAPVEEVGGLVYIWPGFEAPASFAQAQAALGAALAPQGLALARIAKRIDYRVAANWKFVWENNRECWHCHAGHPQYIRANFDSLADTDRNRELARRRASDHALILGTVASPRAGDREQPDQHNQPGLYSFPTPGRWWSANRTPLYPGFVTESIDGDPVAPLMGEYPAYDVGTLRVRTMPNFWSHASADHAVLTRLLPDGPEATLISVYWLVDAGAQAGRDYSLERLLPFWRLTSEQDWALCERNHQGVRSSAYRPGPYSPSREHNVAAFIEWYLERLATDGV